MKPFLVDFFEIEPEPGNKKKSKQRNKSLSERHMNEGQNLSAAVTYVAQTLI